LIEKRKKTQSKTPVKKKKEGLQTEAGGGKECSYPTAQTNDELCVF
jgi:hypothetical protein